MHILLCSKIPQDSPEMTKEVFLCMLTTFSSSIACEQASKWGEENDLVGGSRPQTELGSPFLPIRFSSPYTPLGNLFAG